MQMSLTLEILTCHQCSGVSELQDCHNLSLTKTGFIKKELKMFPNVSEFR